MESVDDQVEDTCRICSAPADPRSPLFHPCKCSGTIKYIHQDCLKTWLEHSKKSKCDVCNFPYSFTKVYSPDMPENIPSYLFIRRLIIQIVSGLAMACRAALVSFVWLVILPYGTVISWRLYFYMGDHVAWWIYQQPRPSSAIAPQPFTPTHASVMNLTYTLDANNGTLPREALESLLISLSADVFTGQIIASLIFLSFVAIFLLREYILQHARPGVFEGAEPPPLVPNEDDPAAAPVPAAPPVALEPRTIRGTLNIDDPGNPLPFATEDPDLHSDTSSEAFSSTSSPLIASASLGEVLVPNHSPDEQVQYQSSSDSVDSSWSVVPGLHVASAGSSSQISNRAERARLPIASKDEMDANNGASVPSSVSSSQDSRPAGERPTKKLRPLKRFPVAAPLATPVFGVTSTPASHGFAFQYDTSIQSVQPTYDGGFRSQGFGGPQPFSLSGTATSSDNGLIDIFDSPSTLVNSKDLDTVLTDSSRSFLFTSEAGTHCPHEVNDVTLSNGHGFIVDAEVYSFSGSSTRSSSPKLSSPELGSNAGNSAPIGQQIPGIPSAVRRPPLALSADILSNEESLPSPSLATYRPPEYFGDISAHPDYLESSLATTASTSQVTPLSMPLQDHVSAMHPESKPPTPAEQVGEADDTDVDDMSIATDDYFDPDEMDDPSNLIGDIVHPLTDSDSDEELEVRVVERHRNIGINNNGPQVVPAPVQQAAAGPEMDVNGDVEDEVEGALEAIGMRGPMHIIVQHAALMIFILDLSIGIGVWLPYTIGKTVALLSLQPRRIAEIINYPLVIVRFVTDPIVDSTILALKVFATLILPSPPKLLSQLGWSPSFEPPTNNGRLPSVPAASFSDLSLSWLSDLSSRFSRPWNTIPFMKELHEAFNRRIEVSWEYLTQGYSVFAYGDTSADRVITTVFGYVLVLTFAGLYLYLTSTGNLANAGRVVRNALKQQLVILKVAGFMVIELLLFPLLCGVILDFSTLGFFENHTLPARWAFFCYAPITALFYHWLAGTIYMYHFAVVLSTCRAIMRPGAMWFIKDPQDPTFQPIRDILDRHTLVQLKKLGLSAVMYGIFIAGGFRSASYCLSLLSVGGSPILPLRWNMRRPLSSIPIDLLFMHIIAPAVLRRSKPKKFARYLLREYWHFSAKQLRLSAYMFGGRYPSEEKYSLSWVSAGEITFQGGYRRVPARDNVALLRTQRTLIETDDQGVPVTEEGRIRMELQNAESIKSQSTVKADYIVVYVPPDFQRRILAFSAGVCLLGILTIITLIAFPVVLGRHIFSTLLNEQVHDGYSFVIGCFLFWVCFSTGKCLNRMSRRFLLDSLDVESSSSSVTRKGAGRWLYPLKQSISWSGQVGWIVFWLGIVIPVLIALVVDLYLILPIRLWLSPDLVPNVNILQDWALGIIYVKVALRTMKHRRRESRLLTHIDALRESGLERVDAMAATQHVIIPLLVALLGMLTIPPTIFILVSYLASHIMDQPLARLLNDGFIFRYLYPTIFVVAGGTQLMDKAKETFGSWGQIIRDNEFLLELRLKNLDSGDDDEIWR